MVPTTPVASPPLDLFTTALLDFFDGTGRTVANGQGFDGVYSGDPVKPDYWYWVLYSIPGGNADPIPTLDADYSTVTAAWQVTAVSNFRNQAQSGARQARDRLLARTADRPDQQYANTAGWSYPITCPSGWQIVDRRPDPSLPGVIRDGDVPAAVFSAPFKFFLTLAPA